MSISQAWKLILAGLKAAWGDFTTLVFLNLIWFFLWLAPMFISSRLTDQVSFFYGSLLLSLILLGPVSGGMQYLFSRIAVREDISVSVFKEGFLKFFWRSEALALAAFLSLAVIVIGFSATVGNLALPWILVAIFYGLWLSVTLFWFLIMQFVFPILVSQDIGVILAVKRAAILVADNLLLSLLLLVVSGILTYLSVFLVIPFVILWFSVVGLMQHYVLEETLKKYEPSYSKD